MNGTIHWKVVFDDDPEDILLFSSEKRARGMLGDSLGEITQVLALSVSDVLRAQSEICSLSGYASTCGEHNSPEWIEGLRKRIADLDKLALVTLD